MLELIWGFLLEVWYLYGFRYPVKLPVTSHCHALITGPSGSGKSQAVIWLIGKLLQVQEQMLQAASSISCKPISLTICDFKNSDDFRFLSAYERYYAGDSCYQGIMEYYNDFTEARREGSNPFMHLLICDEYQALVNYFEAKDKRDKTRISNDILASVSEILMLGRSLNYFIWTVTQRASSSLYNQGSRDNFQVVLALGRQSKEQKGMLFSGETLPEDRVYGPGEGLLLADGHAVTEVKFPLIEDMDSWEKHILDVLCRPAGA